MSGSKYWNWALTPRKFFHSTARGALSVVWAATLGLQGIRLTASAISNRAGSHKRALRRIFMSSAGLLEQLQEALGGVAPEPLFADHTGMLGPANRQFRLGAQVTQLRRQGRDIALGEDHPVAMGHFLGKGPGVRGNRAAPAGHGPGQRATGAAQTAQQFEFARLAVRQHHHVMG